MQNPDVIKAMQWPGKISTLRPILPVKENAEEEDDDTGFHDASSIRLKESLNQEVESAVFSHVMLVSSFDQ